MYEGNAVRLQYAGELAGVGLQNVRLGMHERVEAEREVDGRVSDHRERFAVADVVRDVRRVREALPAGVDAVLCDIDEDELVAEPPEVLAPSALAGSQLEDALTRQERVDAWQQRAPPEPVGSTPRT